MLFVVQESALPTVTLSGVYDMLGDISRNVVDRVRRQILEVQSIVAKDKKCRNAVKIWLLRENTERASIILIGALFRGVGFICR